MKPDLKRQIGAIMDRHPVFSTALIARRCFPSKSISNEYHFGRPGIPVTLRELEEKMMRDVTSVDHFKHLSQVMVERMISLVKGDFMDEAKAVKKEVEKIIEVMTGGGKAPAKEPVKETPITVRSKRGSNKENNVEEKSKSSNASSKAASKAEPVKNVRKSRRGQKATDDSGPKASNDKVIVNETEKITPLAKGKKAKEDAVGDQKKDDDTTRSKRNRRTKKAENLSTIKKQEHQNENVPNAEGKADEPMEEVDAKASTEDKAPTNQNKADSKDTSTSATSNAPTGRGRKRKNATALAPVNSNKSAKVAKSTPPSLVNATIAAKVISGSPGSIAKIAIAGGGNQPLPSQVVLPTTPVAASHVQSVKVSAPPPQVIQLRPSGNLSTSAAPMQIRPLRAPGGSNAPGGAPRPQFFKIVGGKPVQISNIQRLPTGAAVSAIQPPGATGRVVYMRAPVPGQTNVTSAATSSATATTTATAPTGSKIILLSNKGQAIPMNKGSVVSGAPSIVRIVSPNSLTSSGKLALAPNSPTKVTTLRPASGAGTSTGPILLRTVAPRPTVAASGSAPIQLPMAPLPKSALNEDSDKKANDNKAIQVLLPKSPLPPSNRNSLGGGGPPQKSPGGIALTTTTTTASGAFVWTNSTRANFKLSSRINFASLEKFKNVVNKDVHFILASIVTEDKSNEFSFRLHLQREPAASPSEDKAKKAPEKDTSQVSFLELEGKAKVPTAQEWSLKVKTEPPVFLVSKGNFLADFPAVRIPKEIAEKPYVDYELHIDKCSPMQVATASTAAAAASVVANPPPAKKGRKAK